MTLPSGKFALLLGAAAILAPVSASAQEVRNLDNAQSDVLIFEGEVSDAPVVYRYTIAPGTSITVDVVPADDSELDPLLTVTDVATGEVLAEDDDSGGGLASRVRVYSAQGQQVEITVSSYAFFSGEESSGPFELLLRVGSSSPQELQAIGYGSRREGSLGVGDVHLFSIEGIAGQMLEVAMVAEDDDLDPLLTLYQGAGSQGEEVASNDDGGGGLNSLLRYVIPEDGTYTIAAQAYGDSTGDYVLRVATPREHVIQSPQQVLGLGDRVSGYIGSGYENGSLDPSEITYQLTPEAVSAIRAGAGEVTFNMTTPLFEDEDFPSGIDAFLELGFDTPLGFASMMSDDDGGEGLNARIAIDLSPIAADGDWLERLRIRATSIGDAGAYEIEMVEGMQEVTSYDYEAETAVE